jgi:hypothetical protein
MAEAMIRKNEPNSRQVPKMIAMTPKNANSIPANAISYSPLIAVYALNPGLKIHMIHKNTA